MRAATVFESMRNEAQQAKQEAADLHVENVRLKAQVARLRAPVSDEEWEQNSDSYIELDAIGRPDVTNDGSWSIRTAVERRVFDSILAARAAEPKEEPKP